MEGVLGEHHEVHRRQVSSRLGHQFDDTLGLHGEVSGSDDVGKLELYHPEDDAVRGLVEASKATGGHDVATKQATFFDTHSIILGNSEEEEEERAEFVAFVRHLNRNLRINTTNYRAKLY